MEPITIKNIGPIFEASIAAAPGVTVLTGANEVGKSTAIACVAALAGRDVDLSARDGAKTGIISGLGTIISVGKRTTRTGELEVDSVEDRLDLATLVDPGLKDGVAANRKRIKALISLMGTQLDLADFGTILPDDWQAELLEADRSDDPVEMAGKIKRRMEKRARDMEDDAAKHEGKALAARERLKDFDLEAEHDEQKLQSALEAAIQFEATLKEKLAAANEAKIARIDAQEELDLIRGSIDDVLSKAQAGLDAAHAEADKAVAKRDGIDHQIKGLSEAIEQARKELAAREATLKELEADRKVAQAEVDAADAKISAAEQATVAAVGRSGDAVKLQAIIDKQLPPAPDAATMEAAKTAKQAAMDAVTRGAQIRELLTVKEDLERISKAQRLSLEKANVFRNAAKGTDDVLSDAVACDTLKVVEGELTYVEGDRREPYARLSDGKRWQIAITEVAKAIKKTKERLAILPIGQTAWEGLDDKNRDIVDQTAQACSVAIVTAEHGAGSLSSYRWADRPAS